MNQIDAMIVGAEKAGTSSLLRILSEHPKVAVPRKFRSDYEPQSTPVEFPLFRSHLNLSGQNLHNKINAEFGDVPQDIELCLAKNVGLLYDLEAHKTLFNYNPDMKIVICLRCPVNRAYSAFWYQKYRGEENSQDFSQALEKEREKLNASAKTQYILRSSYLNFIHSFLGLIPKQQIKFIIFEEFKSNPNEVLAELYDFLGISPMQAIQKTHFNQSKKAKSQSLATFINRDSALKSLVRKVINRQNRQKLVILIKKWNAKKLEYPAIPENTKNQLSNYFAKEVSNLSEVTDKDLNTIWGYSEHND